MRRLTEMAKIGGCSAKLGPGTLRNALKGLSLQKDDRLIVGLETSDDAGAYLLDDETVLLQTVDFFPPMVDDPYTFGQIAAANALSDVYAMGGVPRTVLNIVCFPQEESPDVLRQIIQGGADKVREAGAVVAGGHSIDDPIPKFGMAVSGTCHPDQLRVNAKAREGDRLILTKPIGTGILTLAMRGGICPEGAEKAAVATMTSLNRAACEVIQDFDVSALTDITGFSLAGHGCEMGEGSGKTLHIDVDQIPLLPDIFELAGEGIVPGGSYRNRNFFEGRYRFELADMSEKNVESWKDIVFDPQTSGGLLIAVREDQADALLDALKAKLNTPCNQIGYVGAHDGVDVVFES